MSERAPLRLAVVGCGRATARLHLPALRRVPGVHVVALADRHPERAAALSRAFGVARIEASLGEVLARVDVDAVAVCTQPESHVDLAREALAAGKHVLVEKPLARTVAECDTLAAARGDAPRVVAVGFNLRHHRLLRRARALVDEGRLGTLRAIRGAFVTDVDLRGDAVFDLGSHHFDLWRWLAHADVESVVAQTSADGATTSVSAQLSRGVQAIVMLGERSAPLHELELLGDRGVLVVSPYDPDGLRVRSVGRGSRVRARLAAAARSAAALPAVLRQVAGGGSDYARSYAGMWEAFAAAVAGEDADSLATLEDGRAAVAIAAAAIRDVGFRRRGGHPA
ncbi:oxidoreductase domain protein [Gemmatirosa kalamazoonensis]|uniref:Oxidoreductase domain protein n=1 Tax=Gemmatirosa kalamazoonensis TaxID=861299 RepID=W0RBC3_9BACT|nr:Gfo/Idh/MocA family oxidoreductase [Gemmatirosa kalamazoonensis]AHG88399.1 oxidoreductase domain protein [Gemmatirosa kalamazoonensis]